MSRAGTASFAGAPGAGATTESLSGVPPHGMKGAIAEGPMSPEFIIIAACCLLGLAIITAGVVSLLITYRRKKRDHSEISLDSDRDRLWDDLKSSVNSMRVPGEHEIANTSIVDQF